MTCFLCKQDSHIARQCPSTPITEEIVGSPIPEESINDSETTDVNISIINENLKYTSLTKRALPSGFSSYSTFNNNERDTEKTRKMIQESKSPLTNQEKENENHHKGSKKSTKKNTSENT